MDTILRALSDPTFRVCYLVSCFALMVLPLIVLSRWFHSRVCDTKGGRDLMEQHARTALWGYRIGDAGRMAKAVAAGRHGTKVRQLLNRTYWLIGCWLILNIISFGVLIWADEVNRTTR